MNNFFGYKNNADDFYGENYLDRKLSEETTQLIEDKQAFKLLKSDAKLSFALLITLFLHATSLTV